MDSIVYDNMDDLYDIDKELLWTGIINRASVGVSM